MKKIIRLTESDLTRIIRRVINEDEFDFNQTNIKLLGDFFLKKNNFDYVGNKNGVEFYKLKRNGFSFIKPIP